MASADHMVRAGRTGESKKKTVGLYAAPATSQPGPPQHLLSAPHFRNGFLLVGDYGIQHRRYQSPDRTQVSRRFLDRVLEIPQKPPSHSRGGEECLVERGPLCGADLPDPVAR